MLLKSLTIAFVFQLLRLYGYLHFYVTFQYSLCLLFSSCFLCRQWKIRLIHCSFDDELVFQIFNQKRKVHAFIS